MSKVTGAGAELDRLTVKVNVVVPALPSLKLTSLIESEGPVTVKVAGGLLTVIEPSVADAVRCAVPGFLARTVAAAAPAFVDTASIVATCKLSDAKLIGLSFMAR